MKFSTLVRWGVVLLAAIVVTVSSGPLLGTTTLIAAVTLAIGDLDAAMKIIFDGVMVDNVVTDSEILDQFQDGEGIQTNQTTGGRFIETSQMFALNAGVGARGENAFIPIPGGPTIVNSQITLKKILGTVEQSAEALKRVRTDEGAYLNWADRTLPNLVQRVVNEMDRMALGYGAGIKARVNDATPAVALAVDSAYGLALGGTPLPDAVLQFLEGENIVMGPNADGTSLRTGTGTVTNIDFDTDGGTITIDNLPTGAADNDYIFEGTDQANNGAGLEPMGLFGMVDDGTVLATFQTILRATYRQWNSFTQDVQASPFAASQKLSEDVIAYVDDQVFIRGGGKPQVLITSRQGLNHLWQDIRADRVVNDPRGEFTGGRSGVGFFLGDRFVQTKVARKMPRTVAFLLSRETFKKWILHDWMWDDTTGSIWKQVVETGGRRDSFFAYGTLYLEMGNIDPQKNALMFNITDVAL